MSEHKATVKWTRTRGEFMKGTYGREHTWTFDGGATVPASASPAAVPKPYCDEAAVDPEEAFVASLASCHMLTFLHLARRAGVEIVSYEDEAVGVMGKDERGIPWVSSVVLHPRIVYAEGASPSPEVLKNLHHAAHEQCFIANSVRSEITVAGVDE
jgi:organic hydroperoxide reductase OsmC/OhrA